jgi:mRNA degradation ribonuclease J1/J2
LWNISLFLQVIPGNETKVAEMLNSLAMQGARVMAGRADNLHVSGHAYQVRPLLLLLLLRLHAAPT